METRARYLLVGIFTIVGLVALLGFTLWLAKVQVDRTYAQYDVRFDTVAGLGLASAVQYNGVNVGEVLTIELDPEEPAKVRVRIEINASTPIRTDTVATLSSQGVTGVSYVSLEGGSAAAERLVAVPPADVPLILSKPSALQDLIVDAPDLLAEAILLMRDIRVFTTPENGAAITEILKNVEFATARIDDMATRTESVMASVETTLARADEALVEIKAVFDSANVTLGSATTALDSANTVLVSANGVFVDDLPRITRQLGSAIESLERSAIGIEAFATTGLPQFGTLASEARALVGTISALTTRIGSDPGRFLLGTQTPDYRR